jgi:hypothetical protein
MLLRHRRAESIVLLHTANQVVMNKRAIPGTISDELGIDPELSVQDRLDALDAAGFIDHPPKGSKAMPTYRQYLDSSPGMALHRFSGHRGQAARMSCCSYAIGLR